jgi:hypothetical protein
MSAQIVNLAERRAMRARANMPIPAAASAGATAAAPVDHSVRFHFWAGASGKHYVHTVYSLIECPEVSSANYVLVKRDESGRRTALSIGRCRHDAASLNLADIRRRGAELGANEVHVHLLAETAKQMKLVELDLKSAHIQAVAAGLAHARLH